MNFVCAYLLFDPELSNCAAKTNHWSHIEEVNFIYNFILKMRVLDDIFILIALIYITVFSNLIIHYFQ
jgi:hypothetical protein